MRLFLSIVLTSFLVLTSGCGALMAGMDHSRPHNRGKTAPSLKDLFKRSPSIEQHLKNLPKKKKEEPIDFIGGQGQ